MSPYWCANKSTPRVLLHGSVLRVEQHKGQPGVENNVLTEVPGGGFCRLSHEPVLLQADFPYHFVLLSQKNRRKGLRKGLKARRIKVAGKRHFFLFSVFLLSLEDFSSIGCCLLTQKSTNVGRIHTFVPTWPPPTSLVATGEMLPCAFKCCFVHCFSQNIWASEQGA